jgi:hypothetical protein
MLIAKAGDLSPPVLIILPGQDLKWTQCATEVMATLARFPGLIAPP